MAAQTPVTTDTNEPSVMQKIADNLASIPSIMADTAFNQSASFIANVGEVVFNKLETTVSEYVNTLRTRKQNIIDMKDSLTALMANYHKEKSYIAELIDLYGKQSWLEKTNVGLTFLAIGALIGAIANLTVIFAVLASCVYITLHFLIMNDFNIKSTRDKQLYDDLVAMEVSLNTSIRELNSATAQLNAIQTASFSLNTQYDAQNVSFQNQVNTFATQTRTYTVTIAELERYQHALTTDFDAITTQFQQASAALENARVTITEQSVSLNDAASQLGETNAALTARNAELTDINQKFQSGLILIKELSTGYKVQLDRLEARVADDERIKNELYASAGVTHALNMDVASCLLASEDVCIRGEQLQRAIEQTLAVNQHGEDIDALLASAANVLASCTSNTQKTRLLSPAYRQ